MQRTVLAALLVATSAVAVSAAPAARPGKAAGYDGRWSIEVITERGDCDRAYRSAIRVENGEARYDGDGSFTISGRVAGNGTVRGSIVRGNDRADVVGRLSGSVGSGTWKSSGSSVCGGRWNADRRG